MRGGASRDGEAGERGAFSGADRRGRDVALANRIAECEEHDRDCGRSLPSNTGCSLSLIE